MHVRFSRKERIGPPRTSIRYLAVEDKKLPKSERLKALLPDVWALVKPRRKILLAGFALMVVNRVCGLALPGSTKILIDEIIAVGANL